MHKGKHHIDISGHRFGRWTVLSFHAVRDNGHAQFLCRCDCGVERVVVASRLRNGSSKSCGCLRKEVVGLVNIKHGCSKHPLFATWNAMMHRCYAPTSPAYHRYGGRGIYVADRWHDVRNFLEDMGPSHEKGLSLDRIDNDGPYSPENVRWASSEEQSRNTRRNRRITYAERTQTVYEWAYEMDIKPGTLWKRLSSGWPVEKALTRPPSGRK